MPLASFSSVPGSWTTLDLLNHLWQSSVVALALLALILLCRRLPARTRLALGWMALAKFAIPLSLFAPLVAVLGGTPQAWLQPTTIVLPAPVSAFIAAPVAAPEIPFAPTEAIPAAGPASSSTTIQEVVPSIPAVVPKSAQGPSLGQILFSVWAAGAALLIAGLLIRRWRLHCALLDDGHPISLALKARLIAAAAQAGLHRLPRCIESRAGRGPCLAGLGSPVLVLPAGLEDQLTPAELDSVLLHELIHARRRDNLWNGLQLFAMALLWFNPVVWLVGRWIRIETEKSCDEEVLRITDNPEAYVEGILKVVRAALGVATPAAVGILTPPVVARIQNIFATRSRRNRPWLRFVVLASGAILIGMAGHAGSVTAAVAAPAASTEPIVLPAPTATPTLPEYPRPNNPGAILVRQKPDGSFQWGERTLTTAELVSLVEPTNGRMRVLEIYFAQPSAATNLSLDGLRVALKEKKLLLQGPSQPMAGVEFYFFAPISAAARPVDISLYGVRLDEPLPPARIPPSVDSMKIRPGAIAIPTRIAENRDVSRLGFMLNPAQLESSPSVATQTKPVPPPGFPADVRGAVLFEVAVDDSGAVRNAYAISSTHKELERPAFESLRQWTFKPAIKKGGGEASASVRVRVSFGPNAPDGAVIPSAPEARNEAARPMRSAIIPVSVPVEAAPAEAGSARTRDPKELARLIQPILDRGDRDFARGERLFTEKECASCHAFGTRTQTLGPDLTGLGGRLPVSEILQAILNPSATISDIYGMMDFRLKDGTTERGRIVSRGGGTISIAKGYTVDAAAKLARWSEPPVVLRTTDIESLVDSPVSIMPANLISLLGNEEIADLVAYLMSGGNRTHPMFRNARPPSAPESTLNYVLVRTRDGSLARVTETPATASQDGTSSDTPGLRLFIRGEEKSGSVPPDWDGQTVFRGAIRTALAAPATPSTTPAAPTPPERISVDFPDEEIRSLLRSVAELHQLNVIMPEMLQGRVSLKLRDVTWQQIFNTILTPAGYTYVVEGNIIRIVPRVEVANPGGRSAPPSQGTTPAAASPGSTIPVPRYVYNESRGGFEVAGFDQVPANSVQMGTVRFGGPNGTDIPILAVQKASAGSVTLAGQVVRPGTVAIPSDRPLRLSDAISSVGSVTRLGNPARITISRRAADGTRTGIPADLTAILANRAEDPVLQDGDVINVPERVF